MILASGARQLVVHEALESTLMSAVYDRWLTPLTNMGASADGSEMITFLAPPFRGADAFSITVKMPVDSQMMSAPSAPHGTSSGLRHAKNLIALPSTVRVDEASSKVTSPLYRPWVAAYLTSQKGSLTAFTLTSSPRSHAARHTRRPMRPKPEIPMLVGIFEVFC